MPSVHFFTEDVEFKLPHPRKTTAWLKASILKEKKKLDELNFIFCSDTYLREINIQYLNHTTFTDIVTFDSSEGSGLIAGDIFISIDRVKENSEKFETTFDQELHRVLIHGVLHLIGYSDKGIQKKALMRKKEDAYLSLR
ncbi:rRNA maturation RNase YbeY [Chryseolinea lacunae]|uniref:Endoribonuclease YbeY n=1 Tax=Chryseolinea lacunae TaxID=2801331 RepID=A0ABS1KR11_9BACT|nr:rRNA maturation RNase YbeY [Chryseolinea lacunae]MBL0741770.1 rRNA maturation RNase YbeY [Chryseolinea lacunae]